MKRFSAILSFLLISSIAYAQETGVAPTPPSAAASGTEGDTWLILFIAIAFVVVAVGVYLFIKRGGRVRM